MPSAKPITEAMAADDERFQQDRTANLLARRADRAQRRELARPLRDGDRHRVEDDERADEERDAAESEQEVADEARELGHLRGVVLCLLDACRTCALGGRIGSMSATSSSGLTPSLAATEIASNWPSRSSSSCAAGIVKTANVAVPSELTLPYCATPTTSERRGPVSASRCAPCRRPRSPARPRCPRRSRPRRRRRPRPSTSLSGLKADCDGSIPKPKEGARSVLIALPSGLRIFVARLVDNAPGRRLDARRARAPRSSSEAGNAGRLGACRPRTRCRAPCR